MIDEYQVLDDMCIEYGVSDLSKESQEELAEQIRFALQGAAQELIDEEGDYMLREYL